MVAPGSSTVALVMFLAATLVVVLQTTKHPSRRRTRLVWVSVALQLTALLWPWSHLLEGVTLSSLCFFMMLVLLVVGAVGRTTGGLSQVGALRFSTSFWLVSAAFWLSIPNPLGYVLMVASALVGAVRYQALLEHKGGLW